ncbi:MDR family MFS transporter [Rhizobium sp. SSA_523]|uniref:MDR family MFS transporter n=1 Tax=Rhizobium sp. SSA_523 TaxID=2952477 RepID=UPI0020919B7E|nr:MDR family MFS transporter [Rhizobium sp. SSA_523]MCO5730970.1 MFS transporter [Rhizobium sp. SSA_523]WKC24222.1 MDR family MFS transporter [Rhizobium sp. SSA_523]
MDMSQTQFQPLISEPRLRLTVFLFLLTAMFMATLDNQIVSTALPTIVGEFGAFERFGWVGSAYLLATSAVMPVYGKLGDLFGRKYVMIAAVTIFTIGSLLCGLAWSMNSLIAARVFQGLGGGGIMVSIFSINADLFEPRERARYQSYSSLVIMASGTVGPTIGGTLSDLFGWRSIFLVNLPIGLVVLAGLIYLLPNRRPARQPKIDYLGAVLLALASTSVVLLTDGLSLFGALFSWQSGLVLLIGLAAVLFWIAVERRAPEPIIPLRLFKDSTFSLFLVVSLMTGGVAIGMVNYFALFLQTTTGLSPTQAGLFFIAVTGGIVIGSLSAGRLISITGRYKPFVVAGLILNVVTLLIFSQLHAGSSLILVAVVMLMQGLSIGLGQQGPIIGVQNAVPRADVGSATGAVTLTRMGGAAIAISVYGAVIAAVMQGVQVAGVETVTTLTPDQLSKLPDAARLAIAEAYAGAFEPMFLTAAGFAFVGLMAALMLKPVRLPTATLKKQ